MILITGASSGIGKSLAYEYAKNKHDLFITSRNIDKLNEIKNDLEKLYQVKVVTFKCDLTVKDDIYSLYNEAIKYDIEVVVNNSGIGDINEFYLSDDLVNQNIIDLNCTALTLMCKVFSTYFIKKSKNPKGIILNVSSIGAYVSGSYMSLYYASKAYVLNLSLALNYELRCHNIIVKAIIPNTTNTNFFKNMNKEFKGMDSSKVSKIVYKNTFNRKKLIAIGAKTKLSIFVLRFIPNSVVSFFMEKALRKRLK